MDDKAINVCKAVKRVEIPTSDKLQEVVEQQYVTVKGKVVAVCPTKKVNIKSSEKVLTKRDCKIADSTAIYRCVTWEEQIELFQKIRATS